jgi:hypothetical protein
VEDAIAEIIIDTVIIEQLKEEINDLKIQLEQANNQIK